VLAILILQANGNLEAQAGPQSGNTSAVDEAAAHAVLTQDFVRLHLPLRAATPVPLRASAWLLSPENQKSGAITADLPAGARAADIALPLPRDKKGEAESGIGWYRIAYRLDSADQSATEGILAIGAIAPNLLELHLARTEPVIPGKPLSVRVYAGNPVTQRPFRNASLTATLEYDDPASKAPKAPKVRVVRTARSDGSGEVLITFPTPGVPDTDATITVVGSVAGEAGEKSTTSIESDLTTFDQTAVHIETDKPLHKPGEIVHLRALVFDGAGRAVDKTPLTLTIYDPQSKTLLETPVETDRFGIASYDWKTEAHLVTGDYEAEFAMDSSSDWSGSARLPLTIERYDLPEFTVTATMDKGYYTAGQTPVVHLHAGYLFGKPVAKAQVRVARAKENRWNSNPDEKPEPEKTAALDANGDATISLDESRGLAEIKDNEYERYVDVRYHAIVTDATTGRSEPRNFTVRLTRYPVHLYLNRLGGNDREGDYIVTASYADGVPASCRITLDWMESGSQSRRRAATVSTNQYGVAKVQLRYPAEEIGKDQWSSIGLRLTAKDAEGRTSISDETVYPGYGGGPWVEVRHSLLKPNQPIELIVHAEPGSMVDVDVLSGHGLLAHERIRMSSEAEPMTIPADGAFHGVVTLWAYQFQSAKERRRYSWRDYDETYKSVLYPENRELKIKVNGLAESYAPAAMVNANLLLRTGAGAAVSGAFGVSVFDEGVEQRAQTEEAQNERGYGGWWSSGESIGGVSLASLDRADLTQAIPDDLDLAAEAVLEYAGNARGKIEAEDYDEERSSFDQMMKKALAPVGTAILSAHPVRLPEDAGVIHNITHAAGLADNSLLDPWDTPYRGRDTLEETDESLTFTSAGPDKKFGTDDDFDVDVAQRNLFALPGLRLTEILNSTIQADRPLPADVDDLKAAARGGGLNLDAVLDPAGKQYRYSLSVRGRLYTVQVFRQDTPNADATSTWPLWTSPALDYFRPTEQRMQGALDAWTATGHTYPNTEAEAKAAFASAGIDVDRLNDPLGNKLQFVVTQLMMYTQSEHVTADAADVSSASAKPVTRLLRAIQVVQPADAADRPATPVAQFLHAMTEQSGSDLTPVAVDDGMFNGNTGAIGGTVTDPSGAVVAHATVTIKSADGSATVETVQTMANGMFLAKSLASGTYTVQFSSPGFQSAIVNEVAVHTYALTTVDMKLNVGAANETVTVASTAQTLQTQSAEVASSKPAQSTRAQAHISNPDQQFTPRLRHVFEETAYWAPSIETAPNGRAGIQFHLPDSLTTWKLHALASTVDGRVESIDQTFRTFQPFFVDLDAPQVMTVGDELTLPATLRNYTAHDLDLPVKAEASDALQLTTSATTREHVAANGSASPVFGLRAASSTAASPLRITAVAAREGDAVEKTIRVHPDGEPRSIATSSLLRGKETRLALDLPADTIPGSAHVRLLLYPNLGSQLVQAMKAALERPYGCGEQTLSSTYPSLLYLQLAAAAKDGGGRLDADVEAQARDYLQLGYTRLKDYFDASGGLTYWGGNDHSPDAALTAYGIEFLTEATSYIDVDRQQIHDAMNWLLRSQQPDGSWRPRYGQTGAEENLYIAVALSTALESKDVPQDLRKRATESIARAKAWAASSASAPHDPYANALRLLLDARNPEELRANLAASEVHDRYGLHWSETSYSPFYGWGRAGDIETTAMVLQGLQKTGTRGDKLEDDALLYLLGSQDHYGVWMSGQATVRVLKALLPLAMAQMKGIASAQQIKLSINGQPLIGTDAAALKFDPKIVAAPRLLDLSAKLHPGHNELLFTGSDELSIASVSTAADVYVPWGNRSHEKATQTSTGAGLDFGYACESSGAAAGSPIECTVDARRFGSQSYGMLLATAGLPPGADVDRASLSKLIDTGTISRYELEPDRIVFYLWPWRAEGLHFTFRFTPRYAIKAKAAPARLEDYYNPDLNVVLAPQTYFVSSTAYK